MNIAALLLAVESREHVKTSPFFQGSEIEENRMPVQCCKQVVVATLSLPDGKKGVLGLSPGKKCSHGSNVSGRKRLIGIFSLSIFLYNFDVLHWKVATSVCLAFHVFRIIQENIILENSK